MNKTKQNSRMCLAKEEGWNFNFQNTIQMGVLSVQNTHTKKKEKKLNILIKGQ